MGIRSYVIVALTMCLLAGISSAVESVPAPLPDRIAIHVAVKNPTEFLEKLGEAGEAMALGTAYAPVAAMLPSIMYMHLPLPAGAWDTERQFDIVSRGDRGLFMVRIESLEATLEAMAEDGFVVERDGDLYTAELPTMGRCWLREAAPGMLAVTNDEALMDILIESLAEWAPTYWGDGDITVQFNLPKGWTDRVELFQNIQGAVEQYLGMDEAGMQEAMNQARTAGVNPAIAKGWMDLITGSYADVVGGIDAISSIALDLRLNGNRVGLATRLAFREPTMLSEIAAAADRKGFDTTLMNNAAADALAVTGSAPISTLLPDMNSMVLRLAERIADIYPERRGRIRALAQASNTIEARESSVVSYSRNGREFTASYFLCTDPDRLLDLQVESINLVSDMLADTISNPDLRIGLTVRQITSPDGFTYYYTELVPENPGFYKELGSMLATSDPAVSQFMAVLFGYRQYMAVMDGVMVLVGGLVEEDDFTQALADAHGVKDRLVGSEAASHAVDDLSRRQIALSVINADAIVTYTAREVARAMDSQLGGDFMTRLFERMRPDLAVSDDVFAVSVGAAGDQLVTDVYIPTAAINAAILNYERFESLVRRAGEEDAGDGDEEEDQSDPEDEDLELDEPAGAA